MLETILDIFFDAVRISGLVTVMMMMIECLNIESKGGLLSGIRNSRIGGVIAAALLGAVPGCMGGFATVSLYTHGIFSFGALVAMMIASCGDEAFFMLAMMPQTSFRIFAGLLIGAIIVGIVVDLFIKKKDKMHCEEHFEMHNEDEVHDHHHEKRHYGWKRIVMIIGLLTFVVTLLGFNDEPEEFWMNIVFGILTLPVIAVVCLAHDHFVEKHLWHHIVMKHLPNILAWSFGVLLLTELLLGVMDIEAWMGRNTFLMILIAAAVGVIPESGPHMIFVTLFAKGIIPLPVLIASCISQDGHASLPLIAESKKSYVRAKLINIVVAIAAGAVMMLF